MKSFKLFLSEDQNKNTHMQHVQNLVLYQGVSGLRQSIQSLRDVRDTLSGTAKSNADITMKWDGAPAIFFGQVPSGEERAGEFFVAKKGIFAKTPKVYMSNEDIDNDIPSGDLNDKMKVALANLSKLKPRGIFQGDMLYSSGDLSNQRIDGESYITFHPNTIVYAIPEKSDLAKKVSKAKMGIVIHTRYTGNTFADLKASYDVKKTEFTETRSVWFDDANVKNTNSALMTASETAQVTSHLSTAGKIFRKISSNVLKEIENNIELGRTIEAYNNSFVRSGSAQPSPKNQVKGLIKYITNKYQTEIDKRKTEKGKSAQEKKRDAILDFFDPKNQQQLELLFTLQNSLVDAKMLLINKLNQINSMRTFLKTRNGFKVTGNEGFVAISGGSAVKLIDQLEFSYANFSDEILKGWESGRN
jgi:hypothetical protein